MNHRLPVPVPARRTYWMMGGVIAAAWGLLWMWQRSPYAGLMGHASLGDHHTAFPLKLAAFSLSWLLMTAAMMLPVSLPLLAQAGPPARGLRTLAGRVLGYLLPWVLVGLLAFLGDSLLHELSETGGRWAAFSPWIGPFAALAAGLYQFTGVKWRCTQQCQPAQTAPAALERPGLARALRAGARYGFYCVGSCGLLMLLLFALGLHQPVWMLGLALILAGERLAPWGRRLGWLVGAVLLAAVSVWLITGGMVG